MILTLDSKGKGWRQGAGETGAKIFRGKEELSLVEGKGKKVNFKMLGVTVS